jgi:hypothetical protein
MLRAFSDTHYNYYRLTQDLGTGLKKGAIFVHDPKDNVYGSVAEGCLKLCWTPDGNCYKGENNCGLCGGTVIFHYVFAESTLFEKVECSFESFVKGLERGQYGLEVFSNGTWRLQKHGDTL